jgi:hypothetical protein
MNYWIAPSIGKIDITSTVFYCAARHCGVTIEQIKGKRRIEAMVKARHIVMAILKEKTSMTLLEIARMFNHTYDHTSVLHAIANCVNGGKYEADCKVVLSDLYGCKTYYKTDGTIKRPGFIKGAYNFTFVKPLLRVGQFYINKKTIEEYKENGHYESFKAFLESYDCSLVDANATQIKIVLNNFKKIA